MSTFLSGIGVVLGLELRQRVRGIAWYVLLGLFAVLVAVVTGAVWLITAGFSSDDFGGGLYSTIIYFVLLLGTLVAPALSGNAINGDRDAGTLATTQVTLITTGQLILGKFFAAWITALAFLAVSLPFLLVAFAAGGLEWDTILVSTLVLALELGVVAAVGVGLSGILSKPLFSIVATYLVVAALSVGTLIAFGLAGLATQTEVRSTYIGIEWPSDGSDPGDDPTCLPPQVTTYQQPRFDYVWGILAINPYVVLADASPGSFDENGNPRDVFTAIKSGARGAQIAPAAEQVNDECAYYSDPSGREPFEYKTSEEIVDETVPSWFVGLTAHLVLGGGLLAWAWARTNTPARTLTKGSRIA